MIRVTLKSPKWDVTAEAPDVETAIQLANEAQRRARAVFGVEPIKLNSRGKSLLAWLQANPQADYRAMFAATRATNATVDWLTKHGFLAYDEATERYIVLHTE